MGTRTNRKHEEAERLQYEAEEAMPETFTFEQRWNPLEIKVNVIGLEKLIAEMEAAECPGSPSDAPKRTRDNLTQGLPPSEAMDGSTSSSGNEC